MMIDKETFAELIMVLGLMATSVGLTLSWVGRSAMTQDEMKAKGDVITSAAAITTVIASVIRT